MLGPPAPIFAIILLIVSIFFIFRIYKKIKILENSVGITSFQTDFSSLFNKLSEDLDAVRRLLKIHSDSLGEQITKEGSYLRNDVMSVETEINRLNISVLKSGEVLDNLVKEIEAFPKPLLYLRFPAEFEEGRNKIISRTRDLIERINGINDRYDLKLYEHVVNFLVEEINDLRKTKAPLNRLAPRLTILDRLITEIDKWLDDGEVLRRMKKLKEEGFSETLEILSLETSQ